MLSPGRRRATAPGGMEPSIHDVEEEPMFIGGTAKYYSKEDKRSKAWGFVLALAAGILVLLSLAFFSFNSGTGSGEPESSEVFQRVVSDPQSLDPSTAESYGLPQSASRPFIPEGSTPSESSQEGSEDIQSLLDKFPGERTSTLGEGGVSSSDHERAADVLPRVNVQTQSGFIAHNPEGTGTAEEQVNEEPIVIPHLIGEQDSTGGSNEEPIVIPHIIGEQDSTGGTTEEPQPGSAPQKIVAPEVQVEPQLDIPPDGGSQTETPAEGATFQPGVDGVQKLNQPDQESQQLQDAQTAEDKEALRKRFEAEHEQKRKEWEEQQRLKMEEHKERFKQQALVHQQMIQDQQKKVDEQTTLLRKIEREAESAAAGLLEASEELEQRMGTQSQANAQVEQSSDQAQAEQAEGSQSEGVVKQVDIGEEGIQQVEPAEAQKDTAPPQTSQPEGIVSQTDPQGDQQQSEVQPEVRPEVQPEGETQAGSEVRQADQSEGQQAEEQTSQEPVVETESQPAQDESQPTFENLDAAQSQQDIPQGTPDLQSDSQPAVQEGETRPSLARPAKQRIPLVQHLKALHKAEISTLKTEQGFEGKGGENKMFERMLLVVSYERPEVHAHKTVKLFKALYEKIFGQVVFVGSQLMEEAGVEEASPAHVMSEDDPASQHRTKFNYGFLRGLNKFKDIDGVLWISAETVLNYWTLKAADPERIWIPGPGTVDSEGTKLWSTLGSRGGNDWSGHPAWEEKLKKALARLPGAFKEMLKASRTSVLPKAFSQTLAESLSEIIGGKSKEEVSHTLAVRGPSSAWYLPSWSFPAAVTIADVFHSEKIPQDIAIPTMMLALEHPDKYDRVLNSMLFIGAGESEEQEEGKEDSKLKVKEAVSLYDADAAGITPWPFELPKTHKKLVALMSIGDEGLGDLLDTMESE